MKNYSAFIICTLCLIIVLMLVGCKVNQSSKGYEGLEYVPTTGTDNEAIKNNSLEYYAQYKVLRDAAFDSAIKDIIKTGEPNCTWNEFSLQGTNINFQTLFDMDVWLIRVITNDSPTGYITLIHYNGMFYIGEYAFEGDPSLGNIEEERGKQSNEYRLFFVKENTFALEHIAGDGNLTYTEFGSDKTYTRVEIRELNKKYIEELLG